MAYLLPENIPTRNDIPNPLNLLGGQLRDLLPDEVTVWLKNAEGDSREDRYLLVLDPACGILLLDAPRKSEGRREAQPEAVRRRVSELQDRARGRRLDGLPVAWAAALPELDAAEAEQQGWAAAGPILTYEDFRSGRHLRAAFGRVLGGRAAPLDEAEVRTARVVVNPTILIDDPGEQGRLAFRPPELSPEETLRALDRRQERAAEHMGWGYRVIRGVAGSGKTLVLVHRARHLARLFPQWRILLLCYNRVLSLELKRQIGDNGQVEVQTLDGLAYQLADPGARKAKGSDRFEIRRRSAVRAAKKLHDGARFDAVLVDEAQDLGPTGMDLAWEMLKQKRRRSMSGRPAPGKPLPGGRISGRLMSEPRNDGNFVMAMDPDQDIFVSRRREMNWNPPGMTARGRTTIFRLNYRNTRQTLELAWGFLSELSPRRPDAVVPEAAREGPAPKVLACADPDAEARTIAAEAKKLLDADVEPGSILVMFGLSKQRIGELCYSFRRAGVPHHFAQATAEARDQVISARGKVIISNLWGLKGLEFSRVFIGGINHIRMPEEQDDPAALGHLLYVCMTRAIDQLTITYSGEGPAGGALQNALR